MPAEVKKTSRGGKRLHAEAQIKTIYTDAVKQRMYWIRGGLLVYENLPNYQDMVKYVQITKDGTIARVRGTDQEAAYHRSIYQKLVGMYEGLGKPGRPKGVKREPVLRTFTSTR